MTNQMDAERRCGLPTLHSIGTLRLRAAVVAVHDRRRRRHRARRRRARGYQPPRGEHVCRGPGPEALGLQVEQPEPAKCGEVAAPPSGGACAGGPDVILLDLNQNVVDIGRLRLYGDGTELSVDGNVDLNASTIAVQASGDANLGILQGFFRDIRSSGGATLKAEISGPLAKPVFSGSATICQRENPAAHAASFARSNQRADCVRSRRRPRRRRACEAGQRRRDVRRPRRVERLHPRGNQPDRGRPADAYPITRKAFNR